MDGCRHLHPPSLFYSFYQLENDFVMLKKDHTKSQHNEEMLKAEVDRLTHGVEQLGAEWINQTSLHNGLIQAKDRALVDAM